jgi:hypothetical protein
MIDDEFDALFGAAYQDFSKKPDSLEMCSDQGIQLCQNRCHRGTLGSWAAGTPPSDVALGHEQGLI